MCFLLLDGVFYRIYRSVRFCLLFVLFGSLSVLILCLTVLSVLGRGC